MKFFCTDEEWSALQCRESRLSVVFRVLAALTPAVFLVLCLLVRTENARVMHPVMLITSGVLGAAAIIVYLLFLRPVRQEKRHLEMLRNGEKEILEGCLTVTGESFRIPKSVRVCRAVLEFGEEERPALLSIDERWADRLPADGTRVRLAAVHSYIAGIETVAAPEERSEVHARVSKVRKFFRGVSLVTSPLVLWVFFVLIFGSFIFYQITDTSPDRKISIYMDGAVQGEDRLAARMEKQLPDPIRMVKIHPFSYVMFGGDELKAADLFIVPDSKVQEYKDWFEPGDSWVLYEPGSGEGAAGATFLYEEGETYHLYIGAESIHREDGLARQAAEWLVSLKTEKEEIQ